MIRGFLRSFVAALMVAVSLVASEQHGEVNFGGLPVPGATVTATQGEKRFVAITDQQGSYTFAALEDGVWAFQVQMQGFETQTREIMVGADTPSETWELKLLPMDQIAAIAPTAPA